MAKINYIIKGSIEVENDVYAEYASEGDKDFSTMSTEEKIQLIKDCELENGNEAILEDAANNPTTVEIVSIEI